MISDQLIKTIFSEIKQKDPDTVLKAFTDNDARETMKYLIKQDHGTVIDTDEKADYVIQEMVGLGVIETITKQDENVTDIVYNGRHLIIESSEKPDPYIYTDKVIDDDYINSLASKVANATENEFTAKTDILEASIGYLRFTFVHKNRSNTISGKVTTMAIRVSRPNLALNDDNFLEYAPIEMKHFFENAVKNRQSIIIAGQTGSAKTALQKYLVSFMRFRDKLIWIEDSAEGHLDVLFGDTKDTLTWQTGPNASITKLIRTALRFNPTWICPTETRGSEAYEMMDAVLSDHGVITTCHAPSIAEIPRRLINMMKKSFNFDETAMLEDICKNFGVAVHSKKDVLNGRNIRYLSEVGTFNPDGSVNYIFKQNLVNGKLEYTIYNHDQYKIAN
ncbi:ATPase, T2SS/T4P/T4SS family [Bacillus sp. LLTC93]|uniref:ATPase, T2SS/T4P/T4SS family n=1 Tax=Bacillus sp. LLTC93 TaxID=2108274 RepID=UPI000D01696C|nr:ATPase, T2SS/T4P/T4SS family [Bacillus sp. LLTC93]PRO39485.1 type IV secretion protein [Bacillus sp. LLTC93]